jgi:predicted amidophosphoribosyltransferase
MTCPVCNQQTDGLTGYCDKCGAEIKEGGESDEQGGT